MPFPRATSLSAFIDGMPQGRPVTVARKSLSRPLRIAPFDSNPTEHARRLLSDPDIP